MGHPRRGGRPRPHGRAGAHRFAGDQAQRNAVVGQNGQFGRAVVDEGRVALLVAGQIRDGDVEIPGPQLDPPREQRRTLSASSPSRSSRFSARCCSGGSSIQKKPTNYLYTVEKGRVVPLGRRFNVFGGSDGHQPWIEISTRMYSDRSSPSW